jgi:RNA polymerase primary sigma factor
MKALFYVELMAHFIRCQLNTIFFRLINRIPHIILNQMKQLKISKQLTNRDTASLDKYLSEISRVELISADEEILLAQKIRKGDRAALDRLAKANLRFVVSVAKQYQNQGMQLPDLISEGNLGLIKAAQRFDEKRGFKFISYAVWWIRQSILQALAERSRIVRLPLNKIGAINKINRAYSDLEQRLERPPSAQEIADLLECSVNDVKQSLVNNTRHISMDSPLGNDDTSKLSLYDILPNDTLPSPENQLMVESLRKDIDRSLSTLSSREMTVMRLYFGLNGVQPMSLEEIGGRFDLTRERVRQIKEKAIRNLRQASRNQVLRPYLG